MKWFIPSWNGDFRLEPDGERTKLVLHHPTAEETALVNKFLAAAAKKKWLAKDQSVEITKSATILLEAALSKAGPALTRMLKPKEKTITAVRFKGGNVEVEEHVKDGVMEALVEKGVTEEAPAAATVTRPTPSCPQCLPGAIKPATEVLLSFLTPEQHADWAKYRAIRVRGHLSGHDYLLAHRHSPIAVRRMGRICYDITDQTIIHFHDWSLPPEEEVLSAKLILESREPWLRNEATCLSFGRNMDVFKNPFGNGGDGMESHGTAISFGNNLRAWGLV